MNTLNKDYRLSLYQEISELVEDKVYIVRSSLDNKIYIKKILGKENQSIYRQLLDLSIPNIPKLYEILEFSDKLIIIEEYINGDSLKTILLEKEKFSEEETIKYILDLISILQVLHSSNPQIIHRDITPSNIMINNDGILKLVDFDISREHNINSSTDTSILGTFGYAAPEQFGFKQSDNRTDIYSLGVNMNIMLTGRFPHQEIYEGSLSKIILKCIEIDPNKRFQTVQELKEGLNTKDLASKNKFKEAKIKRIYNVLLRLPGLNSNFISLKVLSYLWYVFLGFTLLGMFSTDYSFKSRVNDISFVLYLFSLTLLYGNFMDLRDRLFLLKNNKKPARFFSYIVYTLLISLVFSFFIN